MRGGSGSCRPANPLPSTGTERAREPEAKLCMCWEFVTDDFVGMARCGILNRSSPPSLVPCLAGRSSRVLSLHGDLVILGPRFVGRFTHTPTHSPVEPWDTTNTPVCCWFPLMYTVLRCGWVGLMAPSLYCLLWAASWSVQDILTHTQYDHRGTPAVASLRRIARASASPRTRFPRPPKTRP